MVRLFKGIRDTLKILNGILGIQRLMFFGGTCSKCYMILGILFRIFSGVRDIGDPLPGPHLYSSKSYNFTG